MGIFIDASVLLENDQSRIKLVKLRLHTAINRTISYLGECDLIG